MAVKSIDPIQAGGTIAGAWLGYEVLFNGLIKKDCASVGGKLLASLAQMAKVNYQCGPSAPASPAQPAAQPAAQPPAVQAVPSTPNQREDRGTKRQGCGCNSDCWSNGYVYASQSDAQAAYNAGGGPSGFDANNFVAPCAGAGGFVVIAGGAWR